MQTYLQQRTAHQNHTIDFYEVLQDNAGPTSRELECPSSQCVYIHQVMSTQEKYKRIRAMVGANQMDYIYCDILTGHFSKLYLFDCNINLIVIHIIIILQMLTLHGSAVFTAYLPMLATRSMLIVFNILTFCFHTVKIIKSHIDTSSYLIFITCDNMHRRAPSSLIQRLVHVSTHDVFVLSET